MKFMLINLETSQHGRALSPAQFSCVGGVRVCGELEFRHVKESPCKSIWKRAITCSIYTGPEISEDTTGRKGTVGVG